MIVVQTPVRISFVGGGTDFKEYWSKNGGGVITTAIDKYVFVIIKSRFDDDICINYTKRERVTRIDDIQHDLVRETMRKTGVDKKVEITTLADIPSRGTGLGSSSSITVALLHALYSYRGILVTADRLAREACEIEIDILGAPIGIQDQYIAAFGGLRHFDFQPDGSVGVDEITISDGDKRRFESNLRLFYLNKTRSANNILEEQKAGIQENKNILDSMRQIVMPFKNLLQTGDFDKAGLLLHENWLKKKSLAPHITNVVIDKYYKQALHAGALGGKISGAGGGGFLLTYCPSSKQDFFLREMTAIGLSELPFKIEKYGSRVIFYQNGN